MILKKLERNSDLISGLIAMLGLFSLLILAHATALDVLLRWLFNTPIDLVRDGAVLFLSVIVAACFPLTIAKRQNVTIRFVGDTLGARWGHILEMLGGLVGLIIFFLIAWQGWVYANEQAASNQKTWILAWSFAPWWRTVSILAFLCLPVQLIVILSDLKAAVFGDYLDSYEHESSVASDKLEDEEWIK